MAWSRLQSASGTGNGITSWSVTYGSNVSSGTKLIAAIGGVDNGTITSVKDGAGNTFNPVTSQAGTGGCTTALYQLDTPAGDVGTAPTITVSLSATVQVSLLIMEVSGLATGSTNAACVDGTPGTKPGNGGASTGSPTYSSSASNEMLIAVYGDDGGPLTFTAPYGSTSANLDPNSINSSGVADCAVAYENSTGGSETGSWALTGTGTPWAVLLFAFKLAGGGSGPALAVPQQTRARFRQRRSTRQLARQQPWALSMGSSGQSVSLTTAQVNINALPPSLQEQLALTVAQVTIAAPAPSPRVQLSLPVAQVNINALAPGVQVRESLSVAQVNINALAPSAQQRASLTTAQVNINALAPSVRASVTLPVARVNINALPLSIGANVTVNLTTAQVNVSAPAPSLRETLTLAVAQVNVASLAPSQRVQLTLATAQVSVNARASSPQISLGLTVAQVSIAARVPSPSLSLTLAVAHATVAALAVTVGIGNAQPLGPYAGGTAAGPIPGGVATGPQPGGTASTGISGGSVTSPSPGGTATQ